MRRVKAVHPTPFPFKVFSPLRVGVAPTSPSCRRVHQKTNQQDSGSHHHHHHHSSFSEAKVRQLLSMPSWKDALQSLEQLASSSSSERERALGLTALVTRYLSRGQRKEAMAMWRVYLQQYSLTTTSATPFPSETNALLLELHHSLVCLFSLYSLVVEHDPNGAADVLLLSASPHEDDDTPPSSSSVILTQVKEKIDDWSPLTASDDDHTRRVALYSRTAGEVLTSTSLATLTLAGVAVLPSPYRPDHGPIASMPELHEVMDSGDWERALSAIPTLLARGKKKTPLRVVRKSLTALEKASQRHPECVPWEGAMAVWSYAMARPSCGLECREVGRVLTLLSRAHRWRESLDIFHHCVYRHQRGPTRIDGAATAAVLRCLCRAPSSVATAPLEVWAAWRTLVGDKAAIPTVLIEALLRVGVYGSKEAGEAASTAVALSAAQHLQGGPITIPVDFVAHESLLLRLLSTRWHTQGWQAALQVAQVARTPDIIGTVAQLSPPNYKVYEVLVGILETHKPPATLTAEQRRALGVHWGCRKPLQRSTSSPSSPPKHRTEVERVTKVLDQLLGEGAPKG